MTKTLVEVEQFIALRAQGLSYEKISQQIGVSKPVLIEWESKYRAQVEQAKSLELQETLEKYHLMRVMRVEAFSSLLSSALEELRSRQTTFKELSTDKLLAIALLLERRLSTELAYTIKAPLDTMFEAERSFTFSID